MKQGTFDPRSKLVLFLVACFLMMNTPSSLVSLVFTSFIFLVGVYTGEYKGLKRKYITLMVALFLERLLLLLPQSAATMICLIIIVLLKLYLPLLMSFHIVYKTTTISEFMASFAKMHLPQTFSIPFAVMFRFIPTVQEEWDGIRHAMGFRGIGLRLKSVLKHPLQTAEYILVPLLFSCVNVMDELVAASLARGLDSKKTRTCIAQVRFGLLDYALVFMTMCLVLWALTL